MLFNCSLHLLKTRTIFAHYTDYVQFGTRTIQYIRTFLLIFTKTDLFHPSLVANCALFFMKYSSVTCLWVIDFTSICFDELCSLTLTLTLCCLVALTSSPPQRIDLGQYLLKSGGGAPLSFESPDKYNRLALVTSALRLALRHEHFLLIAVSF